MSLEEVAARELGGVLTAKVKFSHLMVPRQASKST